MLFQFLLAASPTTLPATERGTLWMTWAVATPAPKALGGWQAGQSGVATAQDSVFSSLHSDAPSPLIFFFSKRFYLRPPEIWPQIQMKSRFGTSARPGSILLFRHKRSCASLQSS
jgi:hypothetical protein